MSKKTRSEHLKYNPECHNEQPLGSATQGDITSQGDIFITSRIHSTSSTDDTFVDQPSINIRIRYKEQFEKIIVLRSPTK